MRQRHRAGHHPHRFQNKEHDFWNSKLGIVQFANVQETGVRPWAKDTIPRRFCSASALLSDGVWRPVHYLIGEDMGMIGSTWDVEWCVVGARPQLVEQSRLPDDAALIGREVFRPLT